MISLLLTLTLILSMVPMGALAAEEQTWTSGEGITSLGDYCFANCTNLVSVEFPESLESIGDYAFNDCKNIGEFQPRWSYCYWCN